MSICRASEISSDGVPNIRLGQPSSSWDPGATPPGHVGGVDHRIVLLFRLLVRAFAPAGPLVFGIDETIHGADAPSFASVEPASITVGRHSLHTSSPEPPAALTLDSRVWKHRECDDLELEIGLGCADVCLVLWPQPAPLWSLLESADIAAVALGLAVVATASCYLPTRRCSDSTRHVCSGRSET